VDRQRNASLIVLPHDRRPTDPRINVVAFWPYPETTPANKQAFALDYNALSVVYGVGVQMVDFPSEELFFNSSPLIAVEEWTNNPTAVALKDFEHPINATYIIGNSQYRWPSGHYDVAHKVYFRTPNLVPLYGHQAAAIILQDRCEKNAGI